VDRVPHPVEPRIGARTAYRIAPLVRPNALYRRLAARLERLPRLLRLFTAAERRSKETLFGCRMCGQCALPATAYACPMTCPKQLRNGPCGGVAPNGDCEVHPGERCVWLIAYERAEATGRTEDLGLLQRPVDHRLFGSSSWANYWLGRDEGLWTEATEAVPPAVHRDPVELGFPQVRSRDGPVSAR
jgi:hypothetical protein